MAELKFSIPGKVFLLGEYAVLAGRPAVVAAIPPRFGLGFGRAAPNSKSPGGRLLASVGETLAHRLSDPHLGSGGFGASTAEFALHYRSLVAECPRARGWSLSAEAVWSKYRELHVNEPVVPSGADLFVQWSGGVVLFTPSRVSASERLSPRGRLELLVLSAARQPGRKVATHEHLRDLALQPDRLLGAAAALDGPCARGLSAIRAGDAVALGRAFVEHAEALRAHGLEAHETTQDREAFTGRPGVLGIKGSGALQADALVLSLDPAIEEADREQVLAIAKSRGLERIFSGWPEEEGLRCEA
jgi:mevalonate kinase